MALTAVGFQGTVNAVQDARRSQFQGVQLPVVGASDALLVAANMSATLACTITAGVAWAHGVMVTSDASASVSFDTVTVAGQTRWDAVVLRRTWTEEGGTVAFAVVKGTAASNAPQVDPAVNNTPGTIHDQILALVQLTYGSSVPTAVVSKRLWASKVFTATTYGALPAASAALYGTDVSLVDGSRYRCLFDASNNPAWVGTSNSIVELTGTQAMSVSANFDQGSTGALLVRGLKDGRMITVDFVLRRTGSALNCSTTDGNFEDTPMGQLVAALRPDAEKPVPVQYFTNASSPRVLGGMATLTPNGVITLLSGVPGQDMITRTGDLYSVRGSVTFQRKVA